MTRHRTATILLTCAIAWLALTARDPGAGRLLFGMWTMPHFVAAVGLLVLAALAFAAAWSRAALMKTSVSMFAATAFWLLLEIAALADLVRFDQLLGGDRLSLLGTRPMPQVVVQGKARSDIATVWGLASEPIAFDYRTNALGYRNLPDRTDAEIVLLGDSILVAALLLFEDTITARLERALGRPTMNVALIDLSPADEHRMYREAGLQARGRTVVQFLFEGNDLEDLRRDREQPVPPEPSRIQRSLTWNFLMSLQRITQPIAGLAKRRMGVIGGEEYAFLCGRPGLDGHEEELEQLVIGLDEFAGELRASGARYGVVFVPTKLRVLGSLASFPPDSDLPALLGEESPFSTRVAAWAAASGVPFLDLTPALAAAASNGRIPWFRLDTHPNAIGHEVMTAALAEWEFLRP